MTYAELIEAVAEQHGLTKKAVREVLAAFIATLPDAVWESGRVNVPGLGVFEVRNRKGRRIADPTDPLHVRLMRLPPRKVVRARVAGEWRSR